MPTFKNDSKPAEKFSGVIKFFKHGPSGTKGKGRGYGFIIEDTSGKEYFFHYVDLEFPLSECNKGVRVSFELEPTSRGPAAMSIQLINNGDVDERKRKTIL